MFVRDHLSAPKTADIIFNPVGRIVSCCSPHIFIFNVYVASYSYREWR